MGFSCIIEVNGKEITGDGGIIHNKLFDLGPSCSDDTDAPYRVEDLRAAVNLCHYGDKLKDAAVDTFKELQFMVKKNLESLTPSHCHTCTCTTKEPEGWSKEVCKKFLEIDPKTITYLYGGY